MAYMRLGDLLVSSSVITNEQMEKALGMQKETKERLGDVLIRAGVPKEAIQVITGKGSRSSNSSRRWRCSSASSSST